ncbi:hypothetical protein C8E89_1486 [Mycolicibacterium moriokaense]|uniref:Uncharacterized protein n=1 Tax=Mycolicibacterium moriokaense TaxID=39691 RepID=A0A318H6X5_9MYCO|nr:hypothetical protein C8E89_1486 [Mycolicibacterium moriokaense]
MRVDGVLSKYRSTSRSWEADLMQAAYLLELLCRYRLEAEASRATLYANIHQLVVAGNVARADDLRRFIPATEATVVTLDLLGEALRDRIVALRSAILPVKTSPTPRWAESWRSLRPNRHTSSY